MSDNAWKRLEIMRNDLRIRFKEKMLQWLIRKEMHEENEQMSSDESSCEISLTESDANDFEEKCSY